MKKKEFGNFIGAFLKQSKSAKLGVPKRPPKKQLNQKFNLVKENEKFILKERK